MLRAEPDAWGMWCFGDPLKEKEQNLKCKIRSKMNIKYGKEWENKPQQIKHLKKLTYHTYHKL